MPDLPDSSPELDKWIKANKPKYLINKANVAAINFHLGSPEFPGNGCLNYTSI